MYSRSIHVHHTWLKSNESRVKIELRVSWSTSFPKQGVVGSISALVIATTEGIIKWAQNGQSAQYKIEAFIHVQNTPQIKYDGIEKVNLGCISSGRASVYCLYFNLLNDTEAALTL